ncbi:MAG: SIMPL domain-containing protein [Candidatus Sedimenticola sp. 4PFRAG1]
MNRKLALLLTALLFSTTLWAGDAPLTYDRVNLSANAGQEVENDTLVAVLYSQWEDRDSAKAARKVNAAITRAMEKAKQVDDVSSRTLDYNTSPIYSKSSSFGGNKITGWRVRQSLRLESQDTTALSNLLGKLQEELALSSIQYTVSPDKREAAQDSLIAEAIGKFKQRAELISSEMNSSNYRLVNMNINTSGGAPRPYQVRAMAMDMKAAPTLEAGTQRIEVSVSGTIELKP